MKPLAPRTVGLLAAGLILAHLGAAAWLAATVPWTPDERTYFVGGRNLFLDAPWDTQLQRLQGPLGLLPNQLFVPPTGLEAADFDAVRTASRLGMLVFPLLLLLAAFGWSRQLWGTRGALLTLFLAATSPTIFAYGPLLATDVAVASTTLLTAWMLWRWLDAPSLRSVAALGGALGLLLATKYTCLLLALSLPLVTGIALLRGFDPAPRWLRTESPGWLRRTAVALLSLALAGGVAVVVLNACYLFEAPRFGADQAASLTSGPLRKVAELPGGGPLLSLLPEPFVLGADFQASVSKDFAGSSFGDRDGPSRLHYPSSLLFKTPLGVWLLLLLTLALPRDRGAAAAPPARRFGALCLATPALLLLGYVSLTSDLQMGIRYLLPVIPLLLVGCGGWLSRRGARGRGGLLVAAVLAATSLWATVSAWPHHIGYFNALIGGPTGAHRLFADTNCDWLQRFEAGRRALESRHDDLTFLRPGDDPRFGKVAAYALDLKPSDPQREGHVYHWATRFEVIDNDSAAWLVFDARPAAWEAAIAGGDLRAAEDLALIHLRAGDLDAAADALERASSSPARSPHANALTEVIALARAVESGDAGARRSLVDALTNLGHTDLALHYFTDAPRAELPQLILLMANSGRVPEAAALLQARADEGALRPVETLLLGALIYWQGKPRDALPILERGTPPPPEDPLRPLWDKFLEDVRQANADLDKMAGSSNTAK